MSEELKVGDRVKLTDDESIESVMEPYKSGVFIVTEVGKKMARATSEYGGLSINRNRRSFRKLPGTISFEDSDNPLEKQVGGNHYDMPIQPVEFIERNGLGFCVGNCIKYLCRYQKKNGKQDLEKAKHYIDLLIQLEYPE